MSRQTHEAPRKHRFIPKSTSFNSGILTKGALWLVTGVFTTIMFSHWGCLRWVVSCRFKLMQCTVHGSILKGWYTTGLLLKHPRNLVSKTSRQIAWLSLHAHHYMLIIIHAHRYMLVFKSQAHDYNIIEHN